MLKEKTIQNLEDYDPHKLKRMIIGLAKLKDENQFHKTPNGVIMNFQYGMFIPNSY